MTDNFVSRYRFYQSDLVVSLEITDLFLNFTNNLEVIDAELKLSVNIDLVTDLS